MVVAGGADRSLVANHIEGNPSRRTFKRAASSHLPEFVLSDTFRDALIIRIELQVLS
jgi:hypothetical protein